MGKKKDRQLNNIFVAVTAFIELDILIIHL